MEIRPWNDEGLVAKHDGIIGSEFEYLNVHGSKFHGVNLSGVEFDLSLSKKGCSQCRNLKN